MKNYRFSLEGGDITSINPEAWKNLQRSLAEVLEEAGADGLRVSGFQMPNDTVSSVFTSDTLGSFDRVLFSDQVDGP